MPHKPIDPKAIASWRYQKIAPLLDDTLTRKGRVRLLDSLCKRPVCKLSGCSEPISRATLYRWCKAYREHGLAGLIPKERSDQGQVRRPIGSEVIAKAVSLLSADPGMPLSFLVKVLEAQFPNGLQPIPLSTLHRHLAKQEAYARLKRRAKSHTYRRRFVARAPHDIWQMDAKGPFVVTLVSGEKIKVHVMSIIDDATRYILAALVSLRVDLPCAVRVFRMAARRWGLPKKVYLDRASIFDSEAFRLGLADMGGRRIPCLPRAPEARGKIEAYHRTLGLWFVHRLVSQQVVDVVHLQHLLSGVLATVYHPHRHRGLKTSPEVALSGQVSARFVPEVVLLEAFRQEKKLKAHPKTGEVVIQSHTYLVPQDLRGQRLVFLLDPPGEAPPVVKDPGTNRVLPLKRAHVAPCDLPVNAEGTPPTTDSDRWGEGPLQSLYDAWKGRPRPLAEAGFGLPEVFTLLSDVVGRVVPASDEEAERVHQVYRTLGPLPRDAVTRELERITADLGTGRPIKTYLDALTQRWQKDNTPEK